MISVINGESSRIGLADKCIQVAVMSPPYFNLRDYGTAIWIGGNSSCDHIKRKSIAASTLRSDGRKHAGLYDGEKSILSRIPYRKKCGKCGATRVDKQIGLEGNVKNYTDRLVVVFREIKRVLRDDGIVWINLGDSYNQNKGDIIKRKDLIGVPWTVAFALRNDGWYLRCAFPWIKENAMPDPAVDRLGLSHEYWFMFSKSERYYYDYISVAVDSKTAFSRWDEVSSIHGNDKRFLRTSDMFSDSLELTIEQTESYLSYLKAIERNGGFLVSQDGDPLASIFNTTSYPGAHYATFTPRMIVPLIKAGVSEYGCCDKCYTPYERVLSREKHPTRTPEVDRANSVNRTGRTDGKTNGPGGKLDKVTTIGWRKKCSCEKSGVTQSIVLDPFSGSGTTLLVAKQLSVNAVGIDLNLEYCKQAVARMDGIVPPVVLPTKKKSDNNQLSILDIVSGERK